MNFETFDLNLLTVFDAVVQERSLTRAGRRIGLSQPAMSHALSRLRHMLEDELFVRTPDGMEPTPRAVEIAQPLRQALNEMRRALEPTAFDPATSVRRFAIAVDNHAAVVLVPALFTAVSAAASAVRLDILPRGILDVVDRLDRGDLDLAIDAMEAPPERFVAVPLLEEPVVMVMRQGHPAQGRPLSASIVAALPHLEISSIQLDTGFVDRWLAESGLTRRVVLRAPYISAAPILAQSDLVAILSRRIARVFVGNHPLRLCRLPFQTPSERMTMLWHRRLDRHPAHRWLRGVIQSVVEGLQEECLASQSTETRQA